MISSSLKGEYRIYCSCRCLFWFEFLFGGLQIAMYMIPNLEIIMNEKAIHGVSV